MEFWQALFIGLLILAIWTGKPGRLIVCLMLANFAATAVLWDQPLTLGLFDLCCAVVLLGAMMHDKRACVVAGLFALMMPVYVAAHFWEWPASTTYAIIDLLAYPQLAVIGRWDRGLGIGLRAARRVASRRAGNPYSALVARSDPFDDLARDCRKDRGGPKGQVGVDAGQW